MQYLAERGGGRQCAVESDLLYDMVGVARIELTEGLSAGKALFDAYQCLPAMYGLGSRESRHPFAFR